MSPSPREGWSEALPVPLGLQGPPARAYFCGIRCSHLVAPFPKVMVRLGLQVGFFFFFLIRLRLCDATFYMLGVTQAAFPWWVDDLILSAVAPAPRGEDADRSGWEASRANARGVGTCISPAVRSGVPPAFGPEGVGR